MNKTVHIGSERNMFVYTEYIDCFDHIRLERQKKILTDLNRSSELLFSLFSMIFITEIAYQNQNQLEKTFGEWFTNFARVLFVFKMRDVGI